MSYIKIDKETNFDSAVKEFMRSIKESGVHMSLKQRRFASKKSEAKQKQIKERNLKIKLFNKYNTSK